MRSSSKGDSSQRPLYSRPPEALLYGLLITRERSGKPDSFASDHFFACQAREVTTLGRLAAGSKVNLEIDVLARYVARWQETV